MPFPLKAVFTVVEYGFAAADVVVKVYERAARWNKGRKEKKARQARLVKEILKP